MSCGFRPAQGARSPLRRPAIIGDRIPNGECYFRRSAPLRFPTFTDVLAAQKRLRPYLAPTPLYAYPALDELLGTQAFVKHENYQPVGAFKVRGGINLISQLSPSERERGVIAASTGNHGQSVAFAARLFGVAARVVVPARANPGKVAAMQGMGAEVIFHGDNFDAARLHCEELAREHGYRYIHSGDEPLLIAGVATEALEMLSEEPDLDAIFVPVGGGSGAAGVALVAATMKPGLRVIGVQSERAPSAYESWRQRRLVDAPESRRSPKGYRPVQDLPCHKRCFGNCSKSSCWSRTRRSVGP